MLSVNLCGQLIPTKNLALPSLHTHHLFLSKNPNLYRLLRIQRSPNTIASLLQSTERNPQTVKDSLDNNDELEQQEEVELFTVNYLQSACGLSEREAIITAKWLMKRNMRLSKLNRTANADVVLALLREHGFSRTQISLAVQRYPPLLVARPYRTILPKLDFFQSIGFKGGAYLGEFLSKQSYLLLSSLKNRLRPNYNILNELLDSHQDLIHAFMRKDTNIMRVDHSKNLVPNVEFLRDAGVPKSKIVFLVVNYSAKATVKHSQFRQAVIKIQEMGFDCSSVNFIYGVIALLRSNGKVLDQSFQKFLELGFSKDVILSAFRRRPFSFLSSAEKINKVVESYQKFLELGFSKDVILSAFRRRPFSLLSSAEKINEVMDCLVNKMGWPRSDIAYNLHIFRHSLEKRIIPRCSVVLFLHSKGLLKRFPKAYRTLNYSEDCFIKLYVTKYAEVVPEVLQIYGGELNYLGKQEK